jgi:hypothetical protein
LVSYTKAKQIDDASAGTVRPGANSSIGIQNWYNLRAERSKSANDIPQRLVLTGLWEVPLGRSGSALVRNTLGGWQLNVITTIENGPPLSISATARAAPIAPTSCPESKRSWIRQPWSDGSIPRPFHGLSYTLGNASRTLPNVSADGVLNTDMSIIKNFTIKERYRLQFRSEFFNLTNSPTFAAPGSTLNSATFGLITATAFNPKPREIQFGLMLRS